MIWNEAGRDGPRPGCAAGSPAVTELALTSITHELLERGFYKVQMCGKFVEVRKVQIPHVNSPRFYDEDAPKEGMSKEDINIMSARRAKRELRTLLHGNFGPLDKHVVFNLDPKKVNRYDLKEINKLRAVPIARLKRHFGNFKYSMVVERHKDGAIHFHMICNLPYIDKYEVKEYWPYGYVSIQAVGKNIEYALKYITKDANHPARKSGERRYFCSQNLTRPRVLTPDEAIGIIDFLIRKRLHECMKPWGDENEYTGKWEYHAFNLSDVKTLGVVHHSLSDSAP